MNTPTEQTVSSKGFRKTIHWIAALAFIWALLGPFGLRYLIGWSKWLAICFYPAVCVLSGVYLLAKKQRSIAFGVANLLCGAAWLVYAMVVIQALIRGFAK